MVIPLALNALVHRELTFKTIYVNVVVDTCHQGQTYSKAGIDVSSEGL